MKILPNASFQHLAPIFRGQQRRDAFFHGGGDDGTHAFFTGYEQTKDLSRIHAFRVMDLPAFQGSLTRSSITCGSVRIKHGRRMTGEHWSVSLSMSVRSESDVNEQWRANIHRELEEDLQRQVRELLDQTDQQERANRSHRQDSR